MYKVVIQLYAQLPKVDKLRKITKVNESMARVINNDLYKDFNFSKVKSYKIDKNAGTITYFATPYYPTNGSKEENEEEVRMMIEEMADMDDDGNYPFTAFGTKDALFSGKKISATLVKKSSTKKSTKKKTTKKSTKRKAGKSATKRTSAKKPKDLTAKQTTKKYTSPSRKSPPFKAQEHRNAVKVGNDGHKWISKKNIRNIYQWRRL